MNKENNKLDIAAKPQKLICARLQNRSIMSIK